MFVAACFDHFALFDQPRMPPTCSVVRHGARAVGAMRLSAWPWIEPSLLGPGLWPPPLPPGSWVSGWPPSMLVLFEGQS